MSETQKFAEQLKKLYALRFDSEELLAQRSALWKTLCVHFFQKKIGAFSDGARIADIACGYCEFINNIHAREKYAVDLNPDAKKFANTDVKFINGTMFDLARAVSPNYFDAIFVSNFLEHLNSKEEIYDSIFTLMKIIKPGGRILILQPNIKYVGGRYWDFFDHKIPLTENALVELAETLGLTITECIPRFLPYTTKSVLPKEPWLVWAYLKLMPFSGMLLGKQSFLILTKERQQ